MKYKSKYKSIEGIRYTGLNFSEVNEFVNGKLCWSSKEMNWSDNNPPEDLKVILRGVCPIHIKDGDYIVKLDSGEYMKFDEFDFETLFEEAKRGKH